MFDHSYQWRVKGHLQQKSDTIDLATVDLLTENAKIRISTVEYLWKLEQILTKVISYMLLSIKFGIIRSKILC